MTRTRRTTKNFVLLIAMTVAGVTSNPVMAYTPTVMKMSCKTATIAPAAIFHSKRSER